MTQANKTWLDPANRENARLGARNDAAFGKIFGQNVFDDETPLGISRNVDTYLVTSTISLAAAEYAMFELRAEHNF